VGWWAAIWICGDTAGNSVENKGILEDSRRRGHNGGTFQKGGQFKGLPLILTFEQSRQTPPTGRRFSNHGSNEKTFISLMAWARDLVLELLFGTDRENPGRISENHWTSRLGPALEMFCLFFIYI
jgi:hypothetical protein